ncbi:MAG TPA: sporulation transcription factor Spo0A, partial [Clostridiales bacterium]|nr:sporulation transcription factor Spo0A [Clostridiales bacterium]
QNNHINIEIIKLLLSINIPSHLNGYQYLQEAIRMTVYNSDYVHQVTKFIYPGLAKKFNST